MLSYIFLFPLEYGRPFWAARLSHHARLPEVAFGNVLVVPFVGFHFLQNAAQVVRLGRLQWRVLRIRL